MYIIKEGFQAGSANKAIQKIVNVVERKTGKSITVSTIPYNYQNQYGVFTGFYCGTNDQIFRINFLLGT